MTAAHKNIEARLTCGILGVMKIGRKPRRKTEAEVLDHATTKLLAALKRDMIAKDGRVDYHKLRKEGYSGRLLARLEDA